MFLAALKHLVRSKLLSNAYFRRYELGSSKPEMTTCFSSMEPSPKDLSSLPNIPPKSVALSVALLTGGWDKPYTFGLAMALVEQGVWVDVIGSDAVDCPEMHTTPRLNFLNLRGSLRKAGLLAKIKRVSIYYARLMTYASVAKPTIFHILWNNKFQVLDRIFLMLYYKALGKKIVFTVHNVNIGKRDRNDTLLNRLTLRVQYRLADHLFVHTEKMKDDLKRDFGVQEAAISVIPFGINDCAPNTDLTVAQAKRQLGIRQEEKTILFFGAIGPYKGLAFLIDAFVQLAANDPQYRLIIAGRVKEGFEEYMNAVQEQIRHSPIQRRIIQRIQFIPDEETEWYFKAADVAVLPYTDIYQSGVLFLAYAFGLPVVAADVGSFRDEIVEGETGFLFKPREPGDMARVIGKYFESNLFRSLDYRRQEIQRYALERHSWSIVGKITRNVYLQLFREV